MLDEKDIKELGYQLKRRDRSAFHFLYRNYYEKLYQYALRYAYHEQDAQDIVQDAFLSFWKNIDQYNENQNVYSYLLVIVKNSCISYIRHLKIRDKHQDKIIEAMVFSNITDNDIDEDIKNRLNLVLSMLPEKGYNILLEHIVHNKKVKEIAGQMDIAESTVKTHLKRTMKVLRENLMFIFLAI